MTTVIYVLFAVAPKSELRWHVLSIRCMFRLDHGTQFDLIF
jgi:hypothetical protein